MKISVVIATYNRKDSLARCLASLDDQDLPCAEYEIVVVVDGSTDGTAGMLKLLGSQARLVIVEQENRGQASARNAGVAAAKGEIVLFMDDDLFCERNVLSAHLAAHAQDEPRLVCGRIQSVLSSSPSIAERSMHRDLDSYYRRLEDNPQLTWPDHAWVGPNCSCARSAFLAVGGFDDRTFPRRWEDVDLGLRLWESGVVFRFEPHAIASHHSVKTDRQIRVDTEEDGASVVRLCKRHPVMRSRSSLAGMMNGPAWKILAARVATGNHWIAKLVLSGIDASAGALARASDENRIAARLFGLEQSIRLIAGGRREAGSWRNLRRLFSQQIAVLLYHHVGMPSELAKRFSLTVSEAKFRRQLRWLRWRGYKAITPSQWLNWRSTGELLPEKSLMITFDDGYADLVKNAFPALKENDYPAVVFVITKLTEDSKAWEDLRLMTIPEIQYWASRGVEFGGHTRTHPDLTKISASTCDAEVLGSKQDLVNAGLTTISFAYPFGSFSEQARQAVEGVFSIAFTCEEGLNDLRTDPLLMRRTMVRPGDTLLDIEFKAAFGRSPLDPLRTRLRIRSRVSNLWRDLVHRKQV